MEFTGVNLWAVLAAGVACMMVGFLWYSPLLFARPWMVLMGYDPDDKAKLEQIRQSAGKMYGVAFIVNLISAFALGKIIGLASAHTALYGMETGLAVWLGFVTTVQLTGAMLNRKPAKLYLIDTGYQLVSYVVMGGTLAVWPR